MEKRKIINESTVTRYELHNLIISYVHSEIDRTSFITTKKEFDEVEFSKLVYEYIDFVSKMDRNVDNVEFPFTSEVWMNTKAYLQSFSFFECNEGMYIYWFFDYNKSDEINYTNKVEYIESVLANYNNSDDYKAHLKYCFKKAKNDLNFIRENENPISALQKSYDNYDYVKVLKNTKKIDYDDVKSSIKYLNASNSSETFCLTIEQKMCLYLIIFYGLKNIYFNSSKLYKYYNKEVYYNCIKSLQDLNVWLDFFKENKDKISKTRIYSKEYDYYIDLKNEISHISSIQDRNVHIVRRYINSNYLIEPLQLMYFDYLIYNKNFEQARKYLDNNSICLYENLDQIIFSGMSKDKIVKILISEIVTDYNLYRYDTYENIVGIDELFSNSNYKNLYLIPVLRFIIDYLYLLKSENKQKQVDCLYSFLKIFNKGFGIEEFFVKFNYELLLSNLSELKIDNDGKDVDSVINNILNKINKSNLVDNYDVEKVTKMYPHINFANLDKRVQKYIATGDTILMFFDDSNNMGFDYSAAVIEWSKAVELETYYKLTKKIIGDQDRINRQIVGDPFIFGGTIGTFAAINKRNMRDGRTMKQYLYDEYYSKIYNLNKEQYNELMEDIMKIHEPRNDSAHKYKSIDFKKAQECQSIILSAKKILEILSKLE